MTLVVFLIFGLFAILFCYLFYLRYYPKSISVIYLDDSMDIFVKPIKPNRKFFRSITLGKMSTMVYLGNGYYAQFSEQDPARCFIQFNQFSFNSNVYIFKRSKLGRFQSVDLSDRCLTDIINKFKGVI